MTESNGIFLDLLNLRYQNCGRSPPWEKCVPDVRHRSRQYPENGFRRTFEVVVCQLFYGLRSPTWSKAAFVAIETYPDNQRG